MSRPFRPPPWGPTGGRHNFQQSHREEPPPQVPPPPPAPGPPTAADLRAYPALPDDDLGERPPPDFPVEPGRPLDVATEGEVPNSSYDEVADDDLLTTALVAGRRLYPFLDRFDYFTDQMENISYLPSQLGTNIQPLEAFLTGQHMPLPRASFAWGNALAYAALTQGRHDIVIYLRRLLKGSFLMEERCSAIMYSAPRLAADRVDVAGWELLIQLGWDLQQSLPEWISLIHAAQLFNHHNILETASMCPATTFLLQQQPNPFPQ